MVALHHGQPKIMNLKDILSAFVRHRREVVTRRTIFELRKARDRAHILEALAVALANIDPIIELIRRAPTRQKRKPVLSHSRGIWATFPPCWNVRAITPRALNGWSQSSVFVTANTT
jgi:DNA gyrase/topoisomerase IV subunit A